MSAGQKGPRAAHEQIALILRSERASAHESDARRRNLELPAELRILVNRTGQHVQSRQRLLGRVGEVGRRPTVLLQSKVGAADARISAGARFDGLEFCDARNRSANLDPSAIETGFNSA